MRSLKDLSLRPASLSAFPAALRSRETAAANSDPMPCLATAETPDTYVVSLPIPACGSALPAAFLYAGATTI